MLSGESVYLMWFLPSFANRGFQNVKLCFNIFIVLKDWKCVVTQDSTKQYPGKGLLKCVDLRETILSSLQEPLCS